MDYTVGYFEGGRIEGVRSYATLGLSRHHLVHGPSGAPRSAGYAIGPDRPTL